MATNLGELFSLIRNGANIKQYDGASGLPITRIQTISNGLVDRSKVGYADIVNAEKYKSYILQDGDILMSHINSLDHLGKTALYQRIENETLIHGMNLLVLRAKTSDINPRYALRLFQSNQFKASLRKIAKKSVNQASFSVSDLRRLQFSVPSLDSQTYIASLFDTVDNIIAKTRKLLDLLDCLIKSRFIELFGDPVSNSKALPTQTLASVAPIEGDSMPKSGAVWLLNLDAIESGTGRILRNEMTEAQDAKSSTIAFSERHVLISKLRPYLNKVVIPHSAGICTSELLPLLPNKDYLTQVYLAYTLRSDSFMRFISQHVAGAKMPRIDLRAFKSFEIPIPEMSSQLGFDDFVTQVDKLRFDVQQQIEKLQMLKKSLMQEYFG